MGYNIALLVGIGLLITSIIIIRKRLAFIQECEKTTGTVIDIKKETDSDGTTYRPIFKFKTKNNRDIFLEYPFSSNPSSYSVGDEATIAYDRFDPAKAKVCNYFGMFGLAAVLMAVAMPFIVIGGGYHLANMILHRFNG